jgi:hypothetical protein
MWLTRIINGFLSDREEIKFVITNRNFVNLTVNDSTLLLTRLKFLKQLN